MTKRKLDEYEETVVENASENFLRNYIGANIIESSTALEKLVGYWQSELNVVMLKITAEFFEWFEEEGV